jgi:D-beta-D-heptose 7-phosphate kinase/D-beta-D-heptose 1-phosphate adenosyltransferase
MATKKTSRSSSSKIKSPADLQKILKKQSSKNRLQTVFTNGCFDLLHPGHVRYLEMARAQGLCLIVALNSDASVKRLKGPTRPINTLRDRAQVIAALESVDYVTWFSSDTPLKLIQDLEPGILVKGGDWSADQIVGGKEVLSWGGQVKSLILVRGKSTTRTIKKIEKQK